MTRALQEYRDVQRLIEQAREPVASVNGQRRKHGEDLAQEDLAQMLGASRQRVNQELKGFERDGAVRIEPTRLVVLSKEKLLAIASRQ